tara:strand:+ start:9 stop:698 length:690 start_codon:yes stop_codon:yes gene_type:complete
MIDINEKISALYDGELKESEIDDLIEIINEDKDLQKKLSSYNLIEYASNYNIKKSEFINTKKIQIKDILFNKVWVSNALTAAATVLLTLTVTNNYDFSRLDENIESSNKINSAINSIEAQNIIKRSEEYLTDHIMRVLNDPNYMSSQENIDLRNVGFNYSNIGTNSYSKGSENVQLRIEKNDFGLRKVRYWKHGNKMIYLIPIKKERVVTLYGNISISSALNIAESLNN